MSYLSKFLLSSSVLSASATLTTTVFNITVTPTGLMIPFQSESGLVDVKLVSQYYIGSMLMDAIERYPLIEQAENHTDRLPYTPPLSIAHNSPLGNHYRSAMLLPGIENSGFQLIAGISDFSEYCRNGVFSTAQFAYPTMFHAQIALVQSPRRPISPEIISAATSEIDFATINTLRQKDRIPTEVYAAVIEELRVLTEWWPLETLDFSDLISLMPSIEYTIYENSNGTNAVSRIVFAPEDYVAISPDGSFELQVEPAEFAPMLGINFLKYVAIYLNYAENEIGFCDPK